MRTLTLTGLLMGSALSLHSQISGLLISEYVEGSSNNKYLELYNGTGSPINLGGQNYSVEVYANGALTPTSVILLSGTVATGDVFVLAHTSATAWNGTPDQLNGGLNYNGNDAVALRKAGVLMDLIGNIGCMPDIEWGSGNLSTADNTIRRKPDACMGVTADPPNSGCPFPTLTTDWDGFPNDDVSGLGSHASNCFPVPTVAFVLGASSLTEGNSGVTLHPVAVTMDVAPQGTVSVLVTHTGGTGTNGVDFNFSSAVLTFIPSQSYPYSQNVFIPVVGDTQAEADETIQLSLSIGSGTANLGLNLHLVTILNDDVPSTLYSQADGSWSMPNGWNTMPNGSGVYVTDPNNTQGPSGPEYHCIIQPGHDILLPSTKGITTLLVQAGGSIKAGATTSRYLEIYGNSVTVHGTMGNGAANDGIGLEFHGPSATISGAGTIDLNRIRKNGFAATSLTIARSLNLRYNLDAALYNDIAGYPFNVTIQPGITVTVTRGDVSIDGVDGANSSNRWGTFTINGTLDIQLGDLFLRTDNSTAGSQDIFYVVGPGGLIKVGGKVVGNQGVAGAAKAHLTLQSGAQLQLSGVGEVMSSIDPARDPVICQANSLVDYTGAAGQLVEDEFVYANLRISNGGLKTLEGNATVNGFLLLINGILELQAYHLLIGPGGQASGGSPASYVRTNGTGTLQQTVGATTRLFPVGNSAFNLLTLTNTGAQDVFRVRVFDQVLDQGLSGTPLAGLVVNRSWVVEEAVAGGSNVTLTTQWSGSEELTGFTRSACYISHYTPTGWNGTTPSSAAGSNPYFQTRSGLSSFGAFAVGSNEALPVEWLSFEARALGPDALLTWSTASETNNAFFAIERSPAGGHFEEIAQIPGAGTTSEVQYYEYVDESPVTSHQSLLYYRLRQVDHDGSYEYSPIRAVEWPGAEEGWKVYPNPATKWLIVQLPEEAEVPIPLRFYNIHGQPVRALSLPPGQSEWMVFLDGLPQGYYLMEVGEPGKGGSRRWVGVF